MASATRPNTPTRCQALPPSPPPITPEMVERLMLQAREARAAAIRAASRRLWRAALRGLIRLVRLVQGLGARRPGETLARRSGRM